MSYLDILVLVVLTREPAHGYEIRRRVERVAAGSVSLNPNVLYPALHRFEEMGALERTVEPQAGRPQRHVYRLTERGREVLADLLSDFDESDARNAAEFNVRVAFFDLLTLEERLAILAVREAVLDHQLGQIRGFAEEGGLSDWNAMVVAHAIEQTELQRRWVGTLRDRALAQRAARDSELEA